MISAAFIEAETRLQAEILSRILLMRGCRFDQQSIIQRIRIDTGISLEPSDLDELETRVGLRGPAWIKTRHLIERELNIAPERLAFLETLLPGKPAEAGLRFGELLWDLGYREIPATVSAAWPHFRMVLNSATKIALMVKAGAPEDRMDVIRLVSATWRLDAAGITALQVADILMPSDDETPNATELLVRKRGAKPKWKIPRGTRLSKVNKGA